jgi:Coenzyme PQQ synthesis protein D (PqqD)
VTGEARAGPARRAEVFAANPRVRLRRRAADGALLLGLGPEIYELDASAAEIWTRLDGQRSVPQLAEEIAAEYGLDVEEVCGDVRELLALLSRGGFLFEVTGGG